MVVLLVAMRLLAAATASAAMISWNDPAAMVRLLARSKLTEQIDIKEEKCEEYI